MINKSLLAEENHESDFNRFESDTKKIVRRHLEDPNHQISEEEIRNVRIGMSPDVEDNGKEKLEKMVDEVEADKQSENNKEKDIEPNDDPITPWDTIQH